MTYTFHTSKPRGALSPSGYCFEVWFLTTIITGLPQEAVQESVQEAEQVTAHPQTGGSGDEAATPHPIKHTRHHDTTDKGVLPA